MLNLQKNRIVEKAKANVLAYVGFSVVLLVSYLQLSINLLVGRCSAYGY